MPADPGIRLRFRVLLVPISEDGTERHDDAVDGGTTEIVLRLETGRPGPVMRDADLEQYVGRVVRERAAIRTVSAEHEAAKARDFDGDFGDASHEEPEPGSASASALGGPERGPSPRDVPHRARRATFPGA